MTSELQNQTRSQSPDDSCHPFSPTSEGSGAYSDLDEMPVADIAQGKELIRPENTGSDDESDSGDSDSELNRTVQSPGEIQRV